MTIASQIKTAIAQSQSQDERVSITIAAADISEAIAEINAVVDCDVDYAEESDGSYDVWGDDWRLCVTIDEAGSDE
jgi:hypothetical protein